MECKNDMATCSPIDTRLTRACSADVPSGWQPIETAPRDGSWFMICRAEDGFDSYEVGRFEPMLWPEYEETEPGSEVYRKVTKPIFDWRGFNNMHRATHWAPVLVPPVQS